MSCLLDPADDCILTDSNRSLNTAKANAIEIHLQALLFHLGRVFLGGVSVDELATAVPTEMILLAFAPTVFSILG